MLNNDQLGADPLRYQLKGGYTMESIRSYYYRYENEFRIFTMKDNKKVILYDTTTTDEDIPYSMFDYLIQKIYTGADGAEELEI